MSKHFFNQKPLNVMNKPFSLLIITTLYALAFAVVYFLFPYLPSENSFLQLFYADVIATVVVFIGSMILKNSSAYDPYWSVIPPLIAIHLFLLFPEGLLLRQVLVIGLMLFWAIRLTANWARGWDGMHHQDWRYTNIANKTGVFYWPVSFAGIHLMPTIVVFLGCLPLWYSLSSPQALNLVDVLAAALTFGAIVFEWTADEQLRNFLKTAKAGQHMDKGLWALTRHPNYLGEISFWAGMFLFGLSASGITDAAWTAIGTLAMILLFACISIPMMDKRSMDRRPGYKDYVQKVPALWIRFSSKKTK
jgi:steroid 5-alpha reductase family enzyme